ncbi:MAG TPA: tRNA preQ1(34) S-adenosylmethionine ribosyltransferase-isomerase QueA [Phycisphaerales bacterium]|nr:tRNA preQ1(34) S-adenosylmethionine ribosyltransferase-isomerase QueA [Phycisphaerales bacterium]
MLRTDALDYDLPPELIATRPVEPRDACRLLVVSRSDPARREHRVFRDLPGSVRPGDLLVFNTTRVLPARIVGRREDTGGKVGGLYLGPATGGHSLFLLRAGGHLNVGCRVRLLELAGTESPYVLEVVGRDEERFIVRTERTGQSGKGGLVSAVQALAEVGLTPLPPYILNARTEKHEETPDELDREWYQAVYAQPTGREESGGGGSVAAPTAGMHFTDELLARLAAMGVGRADVVLHVGPGTFQPIKTEFVDQHPMHAEWCSISPEVIQAMERTKAVGGRVIAVGTTTARAIESLPDLIANEGHSRGFEGETRLLVTPGRPWRWVDGMVTNFHLPRSTLLAMVGALFPGGVPDLLGIYREAVQERYRFYSYGDAMLVLP